jgi:hypothetical protein
MATECRVVERCAREVEAGRDEVHRSTAVEELVDGLGTPPGRGVDQGVDEDLLGIAPAIDPGVSPRCPGPRGTQGAATGDSTLSCLKLEGTRACQTTLRSRRKCLPTPPWPLSGEESDGGQTGSTA